MMQHFCNCHLEAVQQFVAIGADKDQTRNDGAIPLFISVCTCHLDILHHLGSGWHRKGWGNTGATNDKTCCSTALPEASVPKPSCEMVPLLVSQHCHGEVAQFQAKFGTKSPPTKIESQRSRWETSIRREQFPAGWNDEPSTRVDFDVARLLRSEQHTHTQDAQVKLPKRSPSQRVNLQDAPSLPYRLYDNITIISLDHIVSNDSICSINSGSEKWSPSW